MPDHEGSDVNVRAILIASVAITIVVVAVVIIAGILERNLRDRSEKNAVRSLPPHPRLQAKPLVDIRQLQHEQNAHLNRYGWIDRDKGIVHVPIRHAMSLMVQKSRTEHENESKEAQ